MKIFGQMKRQPRCEDLVGKPINLKISLFLKKMTLNLAKTVIFGLPKSNLTTLKTLKVKPDVLKKT